jgi:hypothetical protein
MSTEKELYDQTLTAVATLLAEKSDHMLLRLLHRSGEVDGLKNFTKNSFNTMTSNIGPKKEIDKESISDIMLEVNKINTAVGLLGYFLDLVFTRYLNTIDERQVFTDLLMAEIEQAIKERANGQSTKSG